MDNYGTHGTPSSKRGSKKHPRFVIHYVPTSCSWLNLIERWFAELTNKRIRRDSFFSVEELIAAIGEFLAVWNEKPKPFVWTATVDSIVAKLAVAARLWNNSARLHLPKATNVCPANSWTLH